MSNKEKKDMVIENPAIVAFRSIGYSLLAIIVSLFVAVFFVMWAKGYSASQYFKALGNLLNLIWKGSFATKRNAINTLVLTTPLIFTGVAHSIAFRCGLFNIGVEGQFIMGMISAAIIGLIPGLNPVVHVILILLGGIIAGGIWGGIPGILKAKFGTNEVVNTIMMNYIAMFLANWVIKKTVFNQSGTTSTKIIQKSAQFFRFSESGRLNISIIFAILVAILVYWLLWKTTVGYEIRAVGINPFGSEYGGIKVTNNIALAMLLSGAIAGIGGATHVAGVLHMCQDFMAFPNFGFDGIAVALLSKSNPLACIPSAMLFGALNNSSRVLQLNQIPKEIVYLVQSIIIIFVATDYILKYVSDKKKKGAMING